ncbi:MAG: hypothetical protein ACRDP5_09450, partial [Streptosporangiaceae bacterium]
ARVVADRADMLREALALGAAVRTGEFAGVTRADLPAAPTGALRPGDYGPAGYEQGPGPRPPGSRRRWMTAGLTAVLCAAAAATGLYLSGHMHGQTGGDLGNTVQHLSSSAARSSVSTSQPVTTSPTPSTVEQPSTVRATSARPKPKKSTKPTSSPKISPSSSSPASSASSSTSASASSSSSSSASASTSSSTSPPAG